MTVRHKDENILWKLEYKEEINLAVDRDFLSFYV